MAETILGLATPALSFAHDSCRNGRIRPDPAGLERNHRVDESPKAILIDPDLLSESLFRWEGLPLARYGIIGGVGMEYRS